ncbi:MULTISPECIES: hypothetical protein [unclassified Arthrobacter]|uniref:hypothetical protein n=1 Tax=unclassified Arthrobacter TaxID=235627 RepID=UPI0021073621|nr:MULTISPECIES: hypothetical protein [unclassified Arthrobacter]MCQ1948210.1 hypothetical protein [Arthrobacter sp. zg-Y1116]MCQ1996588.1 hypothetical protein [Arthrobacter sp. zg-Y1171]UWX82187.1 hypothetical protein N2L00_01725 [Arthrobacter sp. zg-Y1171]
MKNPPIYTSEPMATRALAAEIRQAPEKFIDLLARRCGIVGLNRFQGVRCEASARLDLELEFAIPESFIVGIEAKFDHELTRDQVDRQLRVADHLVVLLLGEEAAPSWLVSLDRVHVLTWAEALACFVDSRLTVEDIASMPVPKSTVESCFRAQHLDQRLPEGWRVDVRRGGGGMPAVEIESPILPNGRTLRGQIQVAGRGMPQPGKPILVEYSIGVSVPATAQEYPDPELPHPEPGWVEPLRALNREVLCGEEQRLLVSTRMPGKGNSEFGKRKIPLAKKYLHDTLWLAKGYTDGWALGIKSVNRPLGELDEIASATVEIFTRWYMAETERLAASTHAFG